MHPEGWGPNAMTPAPSEGCPSTPGTEGTVCAVGRGLGGWTRSVPAASQKRGRLSLQQTDDLFLNLSLGARSEFPRMERGGVPVQQRGRAAPAGGPGVPQVPRVSPRGPGHTCQEVVSPAWAGL